MLTWCKEYEIGVENIDNEHKDIIENFEKLYNLMSQGHGHEFFHELASFLENYVNVHFEHEEILQKELNYPEHEAHKKLHDDFKEHVSKIILQHTEHGITNNELIKLNLFIKDWIINHILVEDKKLGRFINGETVSSNHL